MASSGYQAWSVIAGETPTTTKWNLLGANDASFNTGNGINDGAIIGRHLAIAKTTDANGWTVYDYGTYKEYEYSQVASPNTSVGSGASTYTGPTIPLPVGVTNIGAVKNIVSTFISSDRIFFLVFRSLTNGQGDTGFAPNITNVYGSAVTLVWYRIDIRMRI